MAISRYTLFTDRLRALINVVDAFSRTLVSGLGKINGVSWEVVRGAWDISNDRAVSSTDPAQYPLATLTFSDTDVTISVDDPDPGAGAAFWVTDSGNWYAATYEQEQVCAECQNCIAWNSSNCNSFGCIGSFNPVSCNANTCQTWDTVCSPVSGNCAAWNFVFYCARRNPGNCYSWKNTRPKGFCAARNTGPCAQFVGPSYPCAYSNPPTSSCSNFCAEWRCSSFSGGNCNAFGCTGNFNTSTCSEFEGVPCDCVVNEKVHIFQSVAGTVTSLTEIIFSAPIKSFKAKLLGNDITISAYDATGYVNQIDADVTFSFADTNKSVDHGIIVGSSPLNQGSSLEQIEIEPSI